MARSGALRGWQEEAGPDGTLQSTGEFWPNTRGSTKTPGPCTENCVTATRTLDRPKKRRPETRRKLGECYLADCNPRWLSSLVGPSEDGETAVLAWKPQGTGSKIDWLEFLAGEFAPRDLALSYLGKELGLAPSTIANILKSKKKTARK